MSSEGPSLKRKRKAIDPSSSSSSSLFSLLDSVPDSLQSDLATSLLSHFFPSSSSFAPHHYHTLPGPLPVSITRSHLRHIEENKYWVCEKSDGERAILYVMASSKKVYVVDRKMKFMRVTKGEEMYVRLYGQGGDTVLDGEIIQNNNTPPLSMMVFDILVLNGERVAEKHLLERMSTIGTGVNLPYKKAIADGIAHLLSIRVKTFAKKHHIETLFNCIHYDAATSEYEYRDEKRHNRNDGLILTPADDTYFNKNAILLKWKWPELNTIDFVIKAPWFDDKNKLRLYTNAKVETTGGGGGLTGDTFIRATEIDSKSEQILRRDIIGRGLDRVVVECAYNGQWNIKNVRYDKNTANFITTVFSTMETIADNVTKEDMIQACKKNRML